MSQADVSFFDKNRVGGYKAGVQSRRRIILAMLKAKRPLSARQIASDAGVSYSFVFPALQDFKRAGLVKPIDVAKLAHNPTRAS
ncbi:MAG: hypothetical protein ACREBS_01830 [Nitrososphaerales archaeon]